MSVTPKSDLDQRLEAYFDAFRSSTLRQSLKRSTGNWRIYAAATGSAMAMVTSASASIVGIGIRDLAPEPAENFLAARQRLGTSQNAPMIKAVRLAMARQDSVERLSGAANLKTAQVSQAVAPSINPGGVVPLDGNLSVIQPGEWVSIFGKNLASQTASWNGDFPTSLGGTTVEINGKSAYLSFVSPGQINLQAPDDTATGAVPVVVTTDAGTTTTTVTLYPFSPAFSLLDSRHVIGIILRSNGTGAYGNGTYDILGPTGTCFGYPTRAAQAGDVVELFGVGFGPTNPAVPAGIPFSGAAPVTNPVSVYMDNVPVEPTFIGLSGAGLYQINLIVPPGIGPGDVPVVAIIGGMGTQRGVYFTLQGNAPIAGSPPSACATGGPVDGSGGVPVGGSGGGFGGGFSGGFGGGSGGGSGGGTGGSGFLHGERPYEPRLRFTPDSGNPVLALANLGLRKSGMRS